MDHYHLHRKNSMVANLPDHAPKVDILRLSHNVKRNMRNDEYGEATDVHLKERNMELDFNEREVPGEEPTERATPKTYELEPTTSKTMEGKARVPKMGMVQMPKTDSQKMLGARTKIVSHKAQKPILQEKNEMM